MKKKSIIINADNFSGLETFYDEIDRVLTKDLDWKTGHNLNAFNDLLRGGFGVFEYEEPITLTWKNISKSKIDLGFEATKKYYKKKNGQTLFDIIIEIISEHKHIEFRREN